MRKKSLVRLVKKIYSRDCKKTMVSFKDKIVSLIKTNTTENYSKLTRVQNVFKGQKIIKIIEDIIISDTRNVFERKEEEDYYKPVRVNKFYSENFIICEIMGDKNKIVSTEGYLLDYI